MPLIIMTGYPSSGKTKRSNELKAYFEQLGKEVHVVDEHKELVKAGFDKNKLYNDTKQENHIRGLVKSEVQKLISPRNVVILDGPNYIKGYRYELYCATKSNRSTQCTIYTVIHKDTAWNFNESREDSANKYDCDTFDSMIMRYEDPEGKNRWDSPLFAVMNDMELDLKSISDCLLNKKAPPPNLSTQNAPLSATNFLYDMDKTIKEITSSIVILINSGYSGMISIPGHKGLELDLTNIKVPQLISLSRQYLTYSKMNTPDIKNVPHLYIQYLKSNTS